MTSRSTASRFHLDLVRADRILTSSSGGSVSIGRDPACDVCLGDPHISLHHGEIVVGPQGVVYRDLKSRNGSEVLRGTERIRVDAAVRHQCVLADGDELRLGNPLEPILLEVRLRSEAAPAVETPPAGVGVAPISPPGREAAPAAKAALAGEKDDSRRDKGASGAGRDEPHRVKRVTSFNRFADIETIRQRVGDDKRALQCLYNLLGRLTLAHDRQSMLEAVASLVFESFEVATDVAVYLGPPRPGAQSDLIPAAQEERPAADRFTPALALTRSGRASVPAPLSRMLFERMAQKGEALLFEDAARTFRGSKSMVISGAQSGLSVPLRDRAGIRGVLQIDNRAMIGAFTPSDLDLATLVGNHLAVMLANLEMHENLVQLNRELCDALMRVRLLDTAKEHLARFVPEAVRKLVDKSPALPDLNMVDSDATILFLDIGGYTKLTEQLDRDKVSFLVERYFSSFIDEIYRYQGDINETAGDGLMIIFRAGQPAEHARAAVQAALAIRKKTREINRELEGKTPPIDVHMGINTGTVLLGSRRIQGITGARWTYTATGMVTNVCARLAAHAVEGQILIGPETASRVSGAAALKPRGPVQFKNVAEPLPVFEVLDEDASGVGAAT